MPAHTQGFCLVLHSFMTVGEATGFFFFALQWASLILCDAPVVQQEDLFIYTSGSGKSLVTVDVKALVLFYGH